MFGSMNLNLWDMLEVNLEVKLILQSGLTRVLAPGHFPQDAPSTLVPLKSPFCLDTDSVLVGYPRASSGQDRWNRRRAVERHRSPFPEPAP